MGFRLGVILKASFFSLLIGGTPLCLADPPSCIDLFERMLERNPVESPVGVAHVHQYRLDPTDAPRTISVVVPFMPEGVTAKILNLKDQSAHAPWPNRFLISDGFGSSPFLLIDRSPGSSLDQLIKGFVDEMRTRGVDLQNPSAVVEYLRENGKRFFYSAKASEFLNRQHPRFSSSTYQLGPNAQDVLSQFIGKEPSSFIYISNEKRSLMPFEYYFSKPQCTACMHNAILSSLILQKLNLPHRVRFGAASISAPSYNNIGHSIIELMDGRILDPTWNFTRAVERHSQYSDWIRGSNWWWMPYQNYPYVSLDP